MLFSPKSSIHIKQEGSGGHGLDVVIVQWKFSLVHVVQQYLEALSRNIPEEDLIAPGFPQTTGKHGLNTCLTVHRVRVT